MYNYLFNEEIIQRNHDYQLFIQGFIEGFEKGYEEGFEEGFKEGILLSAIDMLKAGVDIFTISQCTGMSMDEIRTLPV